MSNCSPTPPKPSLHQNLFLPFFLLYFMTKTTKIQPIFQPYLTKNLIHLTKKLKTLSEFELQILFDVIAYEKRERKMKNCKL